MMKRMPRSKNPKDLEAENRRFPHAQVIQPMFLAVNRILGRQSPK